jgi:hypothetical protein
LWVRKRRKVDAIKQQLRDCIAAVQLDVSSLSL